MSLATGLTGIVTKHKALSKQVIYASEVTASVKIKDQTPTTVSGAPMFSPLSTSQTYETKGPYKCTWIDADFRRATHRSQEAQIAGKFNNADIVAKFWLEDVLVDTTQPYGATYFDQADHVVMAGKRYQVLGYDRYGMGLSPPYMIAVVLEGSYTSDG